MLRIKEGPHNYIHDHSLLDIFFFLSTVIILGCHFRQMGLKGVSRNFDQQFKGGQNLYFLQADLQQAVPHKN